jgi:hypothetical protein
MAKFIEWTDEQRACWEEWLAERPQTIKDLAAKFPPDRLYFMKKSNHRVTIYSYGEDNTLTVNVTGEYNRIIFDRQVFGIKPEDLEECDLPLPDELLGAALTDEEEIDQFIDLVRPAILAAKEK